MNIIMTAANYLVLTAAGDINFGKMIIVSLVIGLIVGIIYALSLKAQLKSVYKNNEAAEYIVKDTFKLTTKKDFFVGSKTERTEKPKDNN